MPTKNKNINELIDENFMDKNKFSMTIENMVKDSNRTINYIDAIVDFCESKDIEIESVVKLIAPSLKEKIKAEATRLNYIKKTTRGVLPL
jgi:hypothetical protein|tara:strand:- start:2564 stop:2833 length:270 start_codon:yes stop_codon:yes gene_type:complete